MLDRCNYYRNITAAPRWLGAAVRFWFSLLWISFFAAPAPGAAAGRETWELEDVLTIKRVSINRSTDELAKELFYISYQQNPVRVVPNALIKVSKETLFREFKEAEYGYKFDLLDDYLFVKLPVDWYGGVSAIYEPESKNPESPAHKYIRDLRIPDPWMVAGDERVIADIAALFDKDPEFKSLEGLEEAAFITLYLFYWHNLSTCGGYKFGEPPEGVYICDDPTAVYRSKVYSAITRGREVDWERRTGNYLRIMPKGGKGYFVREDNFEYYFYTWDFYTRRLRFWFFGLDGQGRNTIKEITIGYI
jgi:hypothetical protein